jgi:2-keto-4-pentenoate hydratase/2-oxohepta-3-ene-1,7-dioic acid hydratase in catechol pathway
LAIEMNICRFNGDRLGLVEGDKVLDVTEALSAIPEQRWPLVFGDPLIANLSVVREAITRLRGSAPVLPLAAVKLNSPVGWPTKILAAPANYRKHVEQDTLDQGVDMGVHRDSVINLERPVDTYGLFLKAPSSIVGPADGVQLPYPDRRTDHEVELAVIIGRTARHVSRLEAYDYIAGYAVGLDITVRGTEERSFRKSADSFAVLGPWLTTADMIPEPENLQLSLSVNGAERQNSSTGAMTVGIAELIEIASRVYTLYPGDVLMTGTPEGVGAIVPGDAISACCTSIGSFEISVRAGWPQ